MPNTIPDDADQKADAARAAAVKPSMTQKLSSWVGSLTPAPAIAKAMDTSGVSGLDTAMAAHADKMHPVK